MSWHIAITIALLLSVTFSLVQRTFAQQYPGRAPLSTALMYAMILTPLSWTVALIIGDISFDFQAATWVLIAIGGLLFALANIAAFDASTHVDVGQFNIIANIRTMTTIIVSSIVLNETLNSKQLVGAGIIMSAAILVATTRFTADTKRLDRHTVIAIASSLFFGLAFTNEKWLLDQMSFSTYLVLGWSSQTVAMVLFALHPKQRKYFKQSITDKKYMKFISVMGLIRTVAGFLVVYALQESDNSSLIVSIVSYKTALVVVAAYFILKERDHMRQKMIGAACATVGLLLLI